MSRLTPNVDTPETVAWKPPALVRIARKPAPYWILAAMLAAVTGLTVHRVVSDAETAKADYGATVEVFVTSRSVEATGVLSESVVSRSMPAALVPDDAVRSLAPLAAAGRSISAGAVLTLQDLASQLDLGPAEAAVALPVGPTTPTLTEGQPVLLVLNADPFAGVESAQLVGRVHAVDDDKVTIAVGRADLNALSAALALGSITIAVV